MTPTDSAALFRASVVEAIANNDGGFSREIRRQYFLCLWNAYATEFWSEWLYFTITTDNIATGMRRAWPEGPQRSGARSSPAVAQHATAILAEASSFYDDQGVRFLKTSGRQTVKAWYVGGFEMRETFAGSARANFQLTRYIMGIDGQKIASTTGAPGSLNVAMTSGHHFQLAKHFNGQLTGPNGSISGFTSHSMHLMVAYTLSTKEYYTAHRNPVLVFLIALALILAAWIFAEGRHTAFDFTRRLTALVTVTAFFSVISCGGGGGSGTTIFSEATVVAEVDALYTGLPQGTYFYHSNHLGSSTVVTDNTGAETTRIHYLPYGEIDETLSGRYDQETQQLIQPAPGGSPTPTTVALFMSYTGQEFDPEMETYNYQARMYDPALGSFTTADSIVPDPYNPQAFNRYLYVLGNPIIYTDPSGHSAEGLGNDKGDFSASSCSPPAEWGGSSGSSNITVTYNDSSMTMWTPPNAERDFSGMTYQDTSISASSFGSGDYGNVNFTGNGGVGNSNSNLQITPHQPDSASTPIPANIQGIQYTGVTTTEEVVSDTMMLGVGAAALAAYYLSPRIASYIQVYGGQMASSIAGRFAGRIAPMVDRSATTLGHIFKDSKGHVNPTTDSSKERFIRLFETVSSNEANLTSGRVDPSAVLNGVQRYAESFSNGEVWADVWRSGLIRNAGVNKW